MCKILQKDLSVIQRSGFETSVNGTYIKKEKIILYISSIRTFFYASWKPSPVLEEKGSYFGGLHVARMIGIQLRRSWLPYLLLPHP